MGCDIHMLIQRRVEGQWTVVPFATPFMLEHPEWYRRMLGLSPDPLKVPAVFDNRSYDLFGVLANVRNGTWGSPLPFISEPKGTPPDAREDDIPGDHSFSWLTLRELQEFDWDQTVEKSALTSPENARRFRTTGEVPDAYWGGGGHGERINWEISVREAVHRWPDDVLPILATLGGPDDVRLVFGFDS